MQQCNDMMLAHLFSLTKWTVITITMYTVCLDKLIYVTFVVSLSALKIAGEQRDQRSNQHVDPVCALLEIPWLHSLVMNNMKVKWHLTLFENVG